MIKIDRHIEILLLSNDCVIVPGLGGFIAHHVPARYDEKSDTFVPPLRTLGFNQQLNINDSLLAQAYIEAYDISYPEAIRRIEEEVNELYQRLTSEGRYELNDLGVLSQNSNGKIVFEPFESGLLTPQLYGLSTIEIKPLINAYIQSDDDEANGAIGIIPAREQLTVTQDEPIVMLGKEDNNDVEDDNQRDYVVIKLKTLKYCITTAAVVLFLIIFAIPFGSGLRPEYNISKIDTNALYNLLPKSVTAPGGQQVGNNIQQPTVVANSNTKAKVLTPKTVETTNVTPVETVSQQTDNKDAQQSKTTLKTKPEPLSGYTLVLVSCVPKAGAEDYARKIKSKGVNAVALTRSNGSKVITGNYKTREEAQAQLNILRGKGSEFANAWIMKL